MPNEHQATGSLSALNRIAPESSSLTRRIAAVVVSIWLGGIMMIALIAPAVYRSVDSVLDTPPHSVAKSMQTLGPDLARELLHYQAAEVNRMIFDIWGWVQLFLALVVIILLLFLTNVGRTELGLSLAMLSMALFMSFLIIPRISEFDRQMRAMLQISPAELAEKSRMMHYGFTAFEMAVVVLGTLLLVLLLRTRRGVGHRRPRVEEI